MKITVIISVALVTQQVSASFFDVFQGAVLSVQTSFGKLLSDVVDDVKITVDCTILAVEHVLSLSDDATDRYYEHCKGTEPNTTSNNESQKSGATTVPPKLEVSIEVSNKDLKNTLPAEINATVNETLSKILDDYNIKNKIESVEDVLAKETERLADVSVLVKEELDKLSSEVNRDIRRIKQNDSPPPTVETVLDKIKLLQDVEQNDKNSTEVKEIHQVVEKVLDKLDVIEATEASDSVRLEEMLRGMESNSNNSFSDLEKQFDEWKKEKPKYLDDIKDKMEDEKEIAKNLTLDGVSNRLSESTLNSTSQVQSNNTNFMEEYLEIKLLPSKNVSSENDTGFLSHVTDTPLNIISTGLPSINKPILELSATATDLHSVQTNNTERTLNISDSNPFLEGSSNLIGVKSSLISSSLTTSTDNLISSTDSETVITTDSTLVTPNMVIDQPKANSTSTDENTTHPISDHITETTTIISKSFSNYPGASSPIVLEDVDPYNETTIMDSTNETISTNIFSNYSDIEPDNETAIMDLTSETTSTNIFSNNPDIEPDNETDIYLTSETSSTNIFSDYSDIEPDNETAIMDSTSETISTNIFSNNPDIEPDNETDMDLTSETTSTNMFSDYSDIKPDDETDMDLTSETTSTNIFPNNPDIEPDNETDMDLTSETTSTNMFSDYSDIEPDNETDMDLTSETTSTNIFPNNPDIEPDNETDMDLTSETTSTNIFSNYSDIEPDNDTAIMDSSVTTYEPFIPHTVFIDEYYDQNEKNTDKYQTFDLDIPVTTSESAVVTTVINKDYKTAHNPSDDLDSSHIYTVKPLIDVSTKSIASNLGTSRISRIDEDSQVNQSVSNSDENDSTTEANKEFTVLTTKKPGHDQKVNIADKTSLDYENFFNRETKDSPIHRKAVRDARKLIEDSKRTEQIMNSILKHKKAGKSIFRYLGR